MKKESKSKERIDLETDEKLNCKQEKLNRETKSEES